MAKKSTPSAWNRFLRAIRLAETTHFLWIVVSWILEHTVQTGVSAAMIAVLWGYLQSIPGPWLFALALFVFGCAAWLGNNLSAWLERKGRLWPKKTVVMDKSTWNTVVVDAVDYVVIEAKPLAALTILNGLPEKPVKYPIKVRNTRPVPLEIISYSVSLKWNDKAVQQVAWRGPARATSNGIAAAAPYDNSKSLPAIVVPADNFIYIEVPLNPQNIGAFPRESPKWGVSGILTARAEGKTKEIGFDFETDNYQLTPNEWSAWQIAIAS